MRDHNPLKYWLLTAGLFLLLLVGAAYFLREHRLTTEADARAQAQNELRLLVSLVGKELQEGNYQLVDDTLQEWGGSHADLTEVRLVAANGVVISEYRRPDGAGAQLTLEAPIEYSYTGQATLSLGKDLSVVTGHHHEIHTQVIAALGLVAMMLILLTRLQILYRRDSAELKAEMARRQGIQDALKESEHRYRTLVEQAPEAIVVFDVEHGTFVDANENALRLFGLPRGELLLRSPAEMSPPFQPDGAASGTAAIEAIQRAMAGETMCFEWVHRNAAGRDIPCEVRLSHIPGGGRDLVRGTLTDISARKAVERVLRENESRFRQLFEQVATVAVQGYGPDGTVRFWNKASEDLYGYSSAEAIGANLAHLIIPPDLRDEFFKAIQLMAETGQARPAEELQLLCKDGSLVPVFSSHVVLKNGDTELYCLDVDLSQRKLAEAALWEQEILLSEAQAMAHLGNWNLDLSTGKANWSDEEYRLLGYDPGNVEAGADNFMQAVHPEDRDRVWAAMQQAMDPAGDGHYRVEHRVRLTAGERMVEERGRVSFDADGKPRRMFGTTMDITERMQAETLLRNDREQQMVLREMMEDVVKGGDLEDTLDRCLARLLGVTWLSLLPKGGIFLAEDDGQTLKLVISRGLSAEIRNLCARVPLGRCHCGQAAASRNLQFSDCVDHRHEIHFPGMVDHGHYNLPLISEEDVLGVMVLYLPRGFERDPAKEQFLNTVADVLAGFIRRERAEAELRRHREQLEDLVTERTDKLRQQAMILDQIHDSVVSTDLQARVTGWNKGAERLFGYAAEEALGRDIAFVYPADQLPVLRDQVIQPLLALGEHETEVVMQRKDGQRFEAHLSLSLLKDAAGSPVGMVGYSLDITERKRVERAMQEAKTAAERASRAKSEFLSRMSHELRTPLNAILGFGQLLEMGIEDAEQADNVQEILRAGHHLLELINEVLDLARIEAGRLTISQEPVPLMPLIEDSLTLIRPLAEGRGIRIIEAGRDCGEHVLADRTRLKQVLLNLLSNAVKYNRERGSVSIACVHDGDAVQIRITDTGAGLAPDQQARLFTAFERLDADKHAIEGTGIGLALSKRLMELMQGEIGVESTPGQGSTFWIRLPASDGHPEPAHAASGEHAAEAAHPVGARRWDVLCIEDNPANLRLIERILSRREDIRLLSAGTPGLGLELAQAHRPALILLDINLPDMDGYDVMKCLRENPATRDIPVVAISANAMPKDLARGKAAGFADYVTKPIEVDRLMRVVDAALLDPARTAAVQGMPSS